MTRGLLFFWMIFGLPAWGFDLSIDPSILDQLIQSDDCKPSSIELLEDSYESNVSRYERALSEKQFCAAWEAADALYRWGLRTQKLTSQPWDLLAFEAISQSEDVRQTVTYGLSLYRKASTPYQVKETILFKMISQLVALELSLEVGLNRSWLNLLLEAHRGQRKGPQEISVYYYLKYYGDSKNAPEMTKMKKALVQRFVDRERRVIRTLLRTARNPRRGAYASLVRLEDYFFTIPIFFEPEFAQLIVDSENRDYVDLIDEYLEEEFPYRKPGFYVEQLELYTEEDKARYVARLREIQDELRLAVQSWPPSQ
ncbi:MAG: hypothetical protein AAF203_03915 [Pseudomonadota bacterium]